MKQMAKDAGLEMAFMAEEIGDQEDEFEALECVSLLNTAVLKVDSGASKHFLAGDVHLRNEKPSHVSVQTASKDGVMAMDVNGTLNPFASLGLIRGTWVLPRQVKYSKLFKFENRFGTRHYMN
jgi:hypothetical protein